LQADIFKPLFFNQLSVLIRKDLKLEFRQRVLTASLLLFVVSACFTVYQISFAGKARVNPLVWNAIFWLVLLFSSFQVASRGFQREMDREYWYWFFQVRPEVLVMGKLIYHFVMLFLTALVVWGFLGLFFGSPVQDNAMFLTVIFLACLGISSALTLVSAVAARARRNSSLLPVLGFPLLIPTLMLVVRLSVTSLDALGWDMAWKNFATLCSLDLIMVSLSFILFPYLWRS
jgi:heme exporter protein B